MPSLITEDLSGPGTHALVLGISAYRHFEDGPDPTAKAATFHMEQLSAAARSASEFAAWLLKDYRCSHAPLKSLRVLLSPSDGEVIHPDIEALLSVDHSATIANVEAELIGFRNACEAHTDSVAIVYVAGHGVQLTKNGAIVLLHDFGDNAHGPELKGAIDMVGVHAAMRHPNTARTQFWFVDACRQRPGIARKFEELAGAFTLSKLLGDTESSPLFLAATTGKEAYAKVGGVTLFNEALMWALRGGVADGPEDGGSDKWHVSVTTLINRLPNLVKALAAAEGAEQSVDIAGKPIQAIFHEYEAIPTVDLTVALLPEAAKTVSRGTLLQGATVPVVEDFGDWPMHLPVEAGLYLLRVDAPAPFTSNHELLSLKPPEKSTEIIVG